VEAFALPAAGGRLSVEHAAGGRPWWLAAQGALLLAVVVLALPTRRRVVDALDDESVDERTPVAAEAGDGA
jgi:hypothetical protein